MAAARGFAEIVECLIRGGADKNRTARPHTHTHTPNEAPCIHVYFKLYAFFFLCARAHAPTSDNYVFCTHYSQLGRERRYAHSPPLRHAKMHILPIYPEQLFGNDCENPKNPKLFTSTESCKMFWIFGFLDFGI